MRYLVGIVVGLLIGLFFSSASLIQKFSVSKADHSKPLMRQLLKNPLWLMSLLIPGIFILGLTIVGQVLIGPTLIPGLSAFGMILIPIGASKFLGEKNGLKEYLGIGAIIIGVFLLSISKLSINTEDIVWMDPSFINKTLWYFGGISAIAALVFLFGVLQRKLLLVKAVLFSLSAGFLFGLSNILVAPISYQVSIFTQSGLGSINLTYLILSAAYLALINILAVPITQKAFALGHVSMLIPIQQVPIQIIPIASHFWFFQGTFPSTFSRFSVPTAVILILLGAAALGNKEAAVT